jgi:hypothetical protein
MKDSPLAASAPGLGSLGMAIERWPRQSNPLLRILVALWRRGTGAGQAIPAAGQNDRPHAEPAETAAVAALAGANGDRP